MSVRYVTGLTTALALFLGIADISSAKLAGPHNAASGIGCYNYCHLLPDVKSPYWNWVPTDIDDTPTNHLCNSCHTKSSGPYSMTNAPMVQTHPSLTTDDGYGNWTTGCTSCHSPHYQEQLEWINTGDTDIYLATGQLTSAIYNSGSSESLLSYSSISYKTDWDAALFLAKTLDYRRVLLIPDTSTLPPDTSDNLSFQVVAIDAGAQTITVRGNVTEAGTIAGLPANFGIIYGQLLRQFVKTPAGWNKPLKFYDKTADDIGGFTDQTEPLFPKGVCQVCHTQTNHWRSDGSLQNHYTDRACMECHDHTNGFAHGGGGGTNCEACHGHDAGYEYAPGQFSTGAGSFQSHSTHTEDDADDAKGPHIACSGCHDTNNFPYLKTGTDANGDGKYSLAETNVCDTCHSPFGTYDGVNDATYGAKPIWKTGAYAATNDSTLRAGKGKWCATCHDEIVSIISGIAAPNVVGDEDGAYTYGTGWGYYKTGHGLAAGTNYPASGGWATGAGAGCNDCHDYALKHIDGNARTYTAGSNNYQAGYRLISVNGGAPMNIPRSSKTVADFALCFKCHESDPYLGVNNLTNFRATVNAHSYHLAPGGPFATAWDSDWETVFAGDSPASCPTCHNVHGSTNLSMVRDGKLVDREPGLEMVYDNANVSYVCTGPGAHDPTPKDEVLSDSTATVWRQTSVANVCNGCHGYSPWCTSYARTPVTTRPPRITQVYGRNGSNRLGVHFSSPVYTNSGASGALTIADFAFTDIDNGRAISAIDHTAGNNYAVLTLSANLDAIDDIGLDNLAAASAASIYDTSNRAMDTTPAILTADTAAPGIANTFPDQGQSDVPIASNVSFTLSDNESGIDWSSLAVTLTGTGYSKSYTDSDTAVVSGTGGYASLAVTVNPDTDFPYGTAITVTVNVTDMAGSSMPPASWTFTTLEEASLKTAILHPTGVAKDAIGADINDGHTIVAGSSWANALGSNDADTTYTGKCCDGTPDSALNAAIALDMENLSDLTGDAAPGSNPTIVSVTYHVRSRFTTKGGGARENVSDRMKTGYRLDTPPADTAPFWNSDYVTLPAGGYNYQLVSSGTLTGLTLTDVDNLKIYFRWEDDGSYLLRTTEVYTEVVYVPGN